MNDKSLLIIDDEEKLRNLLSRVLELEGYKIYQAANARLGLTILARNIIYVTLCDVKLPDANGIDLIKQIKTANPTGEIIMLTAFGAISDGVKAIKYGAFDYLTKGDDNDKIIPTLSQAYEKAKKQWDIFYAQSVLGKKAGFDTVIGKSGSIKNVVNLAQKVAVTDTTVLLTGETGTGKEVFAKAIHDNSQRKENPFVAINCSTLGKEIIESELFGHKAGAFTGASKDKKGLVEEAEGGTLFLDEVGEIPLSLQAKLLRLLENREYIKVGDTKTSVSGARIIAATNRNLPERVQQGVFREDLFFRLSVFTIELPPLRDRKEDIIPLAEYFMNFYAARHLKRVDGFEPGCLENLAGNVWKGNIRELRNTIERAVILAEGTIIRLSDLSPGNIDSSNTYGTSSLSEIEKQHIRKVLEQTKGNKPEAARILDIGLTTLYRKIEEYRL